MNENLVRVYKTTYLASRSTSRSILESVQQFGKDATVDASGKVVSLENRFTT